MLYVCKSALPCTLPSLSYDFHLSLHLSLPCSLHSRSYILAVPQWLEITKQMLYKLKLCYVYWPGHWDCDGFKWSCTSRKPDCPIYNVLGCFRAFKSHYMNACRVNSNTPFKKSGLKNERDFSDFCRHRFLEVSYPNYKWISHESFRRSNVFLIFTFSSLCLCVFLLLQVC